MTPAVNPYSVERRRTGYPVRQRCVVVSNDARFDFGKHFYRYVVDAILPDTGNRNEVLPSHKCRSNCSGGLDCGCMTVVHSSFLSLVSRVPTIARRIVSAESVRRATFFLLSGRSQTGRGQASHSRGLAFCLRILLNLAGAGRRGESAPSFLGNVSTGRLQTVPGQRAAWPGARPAARPFGSCWSATVSQVLV